MIGESTPLVSSSSPLSYTPPYRGQGDGSGEAARHEANNVSAQRMRDYYAFVFRAPGVRVDVREVAVVEHRFLYSCLPCRAPPRICCQGVSAHLCAGGFHLLADVDGVAGGAALSAIAGRSPCASGDICIDGVATDMGDRVPLIAFSGAAAVLSPQLTVEDHLWCVVHLHKQERRSWKREIVLAAANFTNLELYRLVCHLTLMERFRLQVAVELVLDPPALFFSYPLDNLDLAHQIEGAALLHRVSAELHKTVAVSTRSLPLHLFSGAESLVLFGAGGLVLFSGRCRDAIAHFNDLHIPQSTREPLWKALLSPIRREPPGAYTPTAVAPLSVLPLTAAALRSAQRASLEASSGRLYSAMCTPPRLSSRLPAGHMHDEFAPLLLVTDVTPPVSPPPAAVLEVATSGDLIDLAAEWADDEVQTMLYAARFYDSPAHAALMAAVESSTRRLGTDSQVLASATSRHTPGRLWSFFVLLAYTLKQLRRDVELLVGVVFLSIGLTLVSLLAHSQPESQGGMFNIRGLIFMAFTLVLFTNLIAMERAREQLHAATDHRKRGLYSTTSFVVCLSVRIMLARTVFVAPFVPFVFFVLRSSYALTLLVWCTSCAHAALQYVLAAALPSKWSTTAAWYVVFGYNIVFSGFLLNLHTLPSFFGALSFVRWGYGAVLHAWLHGRAFACDGSNSTSYCYTGDAYLTAQGLEKDSVFFSAAVIAGYGIASMAILGIFLRRRSM